MPPLLQISYSKKALFIGTAPTCVSMVNGKQHEQVLSTLYVIEKDILCEPPSSEVSPDRSTPSVYAAAYFAHRAWYRSVADAELAMVDDEYEPFNSYINPVRPQGLEDLQSQPYFVMKVRVILFAGPWCWQRGCSGGFFRDLLRAVDNKMAEVRDCKEL